MLWAFSIWLEAVAILPQLFMLQRTGEAETITTHYLFALGAYRALYIPNWLYRYFSEGWFDPIPVVAGLVQTVLYSDFFYIYYTKYVTPGSLLSFEKNWSTIANAPCSAGSSKASDSISQYKSWVCTTIEILHLVICSFGPHCVGRSWQRRILGRLL